MNTTTIQNAEKTAQLVWTGFILLFFLIQAVIWTVAISITARDTSHAVVAGYDEQALNWDEVKRQKEVSQALGWETDLTVNSISDIRGNRQVTIYLTDRNREPIENAIVDLRVFHRGRAAEVQDLVMENAGGGFFKSTLQIGKSGIWQFTGKATANGKCFLFEQRMKIDSNRNL